MYIWAEDGPFIKSGGWDSSKQENMVIIKDVFTSPEYLLTFIIKSLNHTVLQIGNILIPEKLPAVGYPSSSSYYIKKYFNHEEDNFHNSRQERRAFRLMSLRQLHLWYFILSSLLLIYIIPRMKSRNTLILIYCTIVLFLLCNAFITASFANVLERMQNRVFWVFPAINSVVFAAYYYSKRPGKVL